MNLSAPEKFFYDHAGYSYDPLTETPDEGRIRCAKNLSAAESLAREAGVSFEWVLDADADDPNKWGCMLHDAVGNVQCSLWDIDFGPDGSPWGDDYRRVVEAELADEYVDQVLSELAG